MNKQLENKIYEILLEQNRGRIAVDQSLNMIDKAMSEANTNAVLDEEDTEIETGEYPQYTIKIELKVGKETHMEEINPFLKMYMCGLNIVVYNGAYNYQFPHEQVSKITIEAME